MADDFRRIAVSERTRPFFSLRLLMVMLLVVLVAVWLRQNVQPEGKPTMRLVHEKPLRAVDLPPDYVVPTPVPEAPPLVPPRATPEERERAFLETDKIPDLALPPPPDSPTDEGFIPHIETPTDTD